MKQSDVFCNIQKSPCGERTLRFSNGPRGYVSNFLVRPASSLGVLERSGTPSRHSRAGRVRPAGAPRAHRPIGLLPRPLPGIQAAFDQDWASGRITRHSYRNGSEDGALAYKLLVQTGDAQEPLLRNGNLVASRVVPGVSGPLSSCV